MSESSEFIMMAASHETEEPATQTGELTEQQFDQLAEKLIYAATADGILPQDALAAAVAVCGGAAHQQGRLGGGGMSEVSDDPADIIMTRLAAIELRLDAVLANIDAVNARRLAARSRRSTPPFVSAAGGFIAGFVVAVLLLFSKLLF